jgi:DNA polymerase-1
VRFDNIGFFWEDHPEERGGKNRVYIQPDIPDTGWRTPTEFPNLSAAKAVSYDVETYDPELTTRGPGWGRGTGHICGISLGVPSGERWYFPMRHTIEPELNMDPAQVLRFVKHTLEDTRPKIGANLYYDMGWLMWEGVTPGGDHYDIQYAEALLNSEAPNVSLEYLAQHYLGEGKESPFLYQWLADFYGGKVDDKQRANIYRATPRLVGPYAESDAHLPMRIMGKQWERLHEWGLLDLYLMECRLIPLLVRMRLQGAPVDLAYTEQLHDELAGDILEADAKLKHYVGFEVNVAASTNLAKAFDQLGLDYPKTAKGNPSFKQEFLTDHGHPFAQLVTERRQMEKIRGTFLQSYIMDSHVNGRVHGEFHPLKGDGYGARSGRFASRNPNLQNIPTRSNLGKRVRKAFKDHQGRAWRKYDYSQIEYRLLAHHAVGRGSDVIRQRYLDDPTTDYHVATQKLVLELTGLDIARPKIKNINFGFIYGMSQPKLARYLGLDATTAKELFDSYHAAVPFARETMQYYMDLIERQGYVSTFAGRRSQFNKWTSKSWRDDADSLDFEDAVMEYGRVKRAFTHKGLNRVLQGGAADIMKRAMVQCYEDGLFGETGIPLLTVHDELDFVDNGCRAEVWAEMARVMERCAPELSIPIMVDHEIGPSWGEVAEVQLAA